MKRFPFSLRFSIPLMLLIFGSLLGVFSFQREVDQSYRRQEEDGINDLKFSANQLSGMLEYLYRRGDVEQVEIAISKLGSERNIRLALLCDENNRIILATRYELRNRPIASISLPNYLPEEFFKVREMMSGEVKLAENKESIWAIYPVLLGSQPGEVRPSRVGILLVEYDILLVKQQAYADALQRSTETSMGLAVFCIIVWLFFDRTLTGRAARLVAASNSFSQGKLGDRAQLGGSDELAQIAAAFNQMGDRIQSDTEVLQDSEKRFRTLVSNLPGAVYRWVFDADWTIEFISDAIADISGYPATDFINNRVRSFNSIIHAEDAAMVQKIIDKRILTKRDYIIEYRIIRADRTVRWMSDKGQGIFNENGDLLWLDGVIFDITKRKHAEAELRQILELKDKLAATATAQSKQLKQTLQDLQKTQAQLIQTEKMSSLGQTIAGVAHEINNPVNFIHANLSHVSTYSNNLLSLIDLYQQEYPNPTAEIADLIEDSDLEFIGEDLPKILSSMKVGTNRIREIVLSLRNFSRLDESDLKPVNIHEGIDSTLLILQSALKAKPNFAEIEIVKEYGDLPLVECYAGQLNQVFMNILTNSIYALHNSENQDFKKYKTPFHCQIIINTCILKNNWVKISIKDNGPGIDDAVKTKVFDPFFTTKPVGTGTGLGLSVCYQIVVDKHGGRLECISTVGEGTEFAIEIPIAKSRS
ncbi:MAG: PAS domain-containing protein [Microcoleus sp. PH2017_10_PVI_O_A]|uniref:ATP-binding protein n=1 Tax=unclassified Microcoleus TaxID=2642155 RepID=UPI001DB35148|nr:MULTISPECIES: ATP-binding protein [unclassified Microcoleus]TAE80372.1 MAG: PAS domain S-box protein [Oscillatoriales cyanobacterium]MCC3409679.1 PAS domain-containing protein [Microcoleus sp. PH2017_10_PVI_O_A]MCC3463943.1 PAS domain-containing protein [Microcoleus sp. PH2017_11_PCY_U_A]MCC3482269.1 PAS domain-containing protein [Microcoleus sp. PH2017_12_PCY_D_A]MCC3529094.1 PAS domain-containing protein [Microcoleus sp. PH2017_21_RUC_O_A]